jgi:TolA-binding protein
MNSNIQGNNSPTTDSESESKYESIVHRVEELEQRVDNQQETIEEQQSTIDDQQDEIDELRQELSNHQERSGRKLAETLKHVNQLQESFEGDSGGTAPTPTDGRTTIQKHELTPVEQISRADSENLDEVIDSPSVRRAVSLFKNIVDWGNRTPKGIVLKSSDNPLSLLSADMDNSLCWKQYYRAAEALESLSEGALTFFNDSRHGKMLVLHEHSDVYDRMMNGSLSVSSVGAEG